MYFFTAGHYYDCPTCDSYGSEPDEIFISPHYESKDELLKKMAEMIPDYRFYSIYEIQEYGEIKAAVPEIINHNAGHRVQSIKFKWDNNIYEFNNVGLLAITEVKNEQST